MDIDIWKFLAGLMLFLLAMSLIEQSVQGLAGRKFKGLIARNTHPPLRGIFTGTVATAALQSSSLVSLMMLAFVGARVVPMKEALLVVFGANLGTTATGWIVAAIGFKLDLESLALPLIAVGGLLRAVVQHNRTGDFGRLVMGIGVLLLALQFMKGSVEDVSALIDPETLADLSGVEYLLFGLLFSAIVQSSSATMVITLSLLDAGIIDLSAAAAMIIGADLGTTSTVLLGAIGGTPNKKRLALGHFLFNLVTDLIAFVVRLPLLAALAFMHDPLLTLVAFHSTFNLVGLIFWTPMIGSFAALLEKCFTGSTSKVSLYLEDTASAVPETALHALWQEITHLLNRVVRHNGAVFHGPDSDLSATAATGEPAIEPKFADAYQTTKNLEGEILSYALDLDRSQLSNSDLELLNGLLQVTRDALVASKQLKDVLADLEETAVEHSKLYQLLCTTQASFYQDLRQVCRYIPSITKNQIEVLASTVEENHRLCHERIHAAIQADVFPATRISSVLNINRSFFNSNRAMLTSLAQFAELLALRHDHRASAKRS